MKLKFQWAVEGPNRTVATCTGCVNRHGVSPICALLTDNGGFLDQVSLPYIEEVIATVDAVLRGDQAADSCTREWLEAEFNASAVRIQSIDDEERYRQSISTINFRQVLVAWRDFIQAGPQYDAHDEVEILEM